jgi:hypothetical protein
MKGLPALTHAGTLTGGDRHATGPVQQGSRAGSNFKRSQGGPDDPRVIEKLGRDNPGRQA